MYGVESDAPFRDLDDFEYILVVDPGPLVTFGALDRFDLLLNRKLAVVVLDALFFELMRCRSHSLVNGRIYQFFLDKEPLWSQRTPLGVEFYDALLGDRSKVADGCGWFQNSCAGMERFLTACGVKTSVGGVWCERFCEAIQNDAIQGDDYVERSMLDFLENRFHDRLLHPVLLLYEDSRIKTDFEFPSIVSPFSTARFMKFIEAHGLVDNADALIGEALGLGRVFPDLNVDPRRFQN